MFCNNIDELLLRVIKSRGLNPGEIEPLTGLDDGQGFLKIALVVVDPDDDSEKEKGSRCKYSEVKFI